MKKIFVKLSMLLFVLVMSTTAWASSEMIAQLQKKYWAQLTGLNSSESTGGGKVYVTTTTGYEPTDDDWTNWSEGENNVAVDGRAVCAPGMVQSQVVFYSFAKANDGFYFTGWSYANNGIDLGDEQPLTLQLDPSNVMGDEETPNAKEYTLYATFEPVRITGYSLSGSNTNTKNGDNWESTQTITYTFLGENIDAADFESISIVPADAAWTVNDDFTVNGGAKTGTVSVTFSTTSDAKNEYSANLRLTTKAGITMEITLNARTVASGVEAFLFDEKTPKETGTTTLSGLLAKNFSSYANPIIKLNGDYANAVTLNKDITFDLNGYNLNNTLTINDNANVTLAHSPYGGSVANDVTVAAGSKLILNGGTISGAITNNGALEQNGATIEGVLVNNGTMTSTDGIHHATLTSTGTLVVNGGTFEPASGVAIDVTGGTAEIKKGTIMGVTYGVQSAGTTTIEKLAFISGGTKALKKTAGTLRVNCGKFVNPNSLNEGDIDFRSAYFKDSTNTTGGNVQGKQLYYNTAGAEFRDGYNFFAGEQMVAQSEGISMCRIGAFSYASLEDALAYARTTSEELIIVMLNDYVMPSGNYTLPSNATLLVPMAGDQDAVSPVINRVISRSASRAEAGVETEWVKPTRFRTLTLSEGVNLEVIGSIEVSGSQYCTDESFTGTPYGPYGHIQMNAGSTMVLQSGSELRAWGYITGDLNHVSNTFSVPMGEIDARRGATIREPFQMGDWKDYEWSGRALLSNTHKIFPLSQYFIQNIEVPVKYHPGAVLSGTTAVAAYIPYSRATHLPVIGNMIPDNYDISVAMSANDIKIIGVSKVDEAIFLMDNDADADNTWVRKWYDASTDQQVYEVNSGAHIGSMVIPLVSAFGLDLNMNSGAFRLPITNNFKIHVLSGTMDFTQTTELLPNSVVEVDKEAIVYVSTDGDAEEKGSLFLYDADQWGEYALGQYARRVKYSPVFDNEPTIRGISFSDLEDAAINVHGTFDTRAGYVYTTTNDEVTVGGANIFSSVEDAGTFLFSIPAKTSGEYEEMYQVEGNDINNLSDSEPAKCVSAWLKNENGYVNTAGTEENKSYCYLDMGNGGEWTMLEQRGCFTYDGASNTYYIKPQEYVAVVVNSATQTGDDWTMIGNDDHTFSDAAGAGRLFINLGNPYEASTCQWWEVEQKDNYYHCIHPLNDTYYEWVDDPDEEDPYYGEWKEVEFTITWKDWDGTILKTIAPDPESSEMIEVESYTVPYGTQAEWLSSNPTREKDVDYIYDFTGWSPELGKVTNNVTYTATYEKKQIKYTIAFIQDGGVEIERHLLARDEMPVCENEPTRTGYILQWEPALGPVTGNQTYTATWLPEPPETYTITFKNYDGTVLKKANGTDDAVYTVTAEYTPAYDGETPEKTATSEYKYTFAGWKPALAPATTNATYVAQFDEVQALYTVKFLKEGADPNDYDEDDIIEENQYQYGEMPVCSTPPTQPTSADLAQYTYKLKWTPQIQTVMGNQVYVADFDRTNNKYTVTLRSTNEAVCTFTGAGIYNYGESANIQAVITDPSNYEFVKWLETEGTEANLGATIVNDNITLTAVVKKSTIDEGDLVLVTDGHREVTVAVDVNDFIIKSDGEQAGYLEGNANLLKVWGDAYFDLTLNASSRTWYAVAVPWNVNAETGISELGGSHLVLGTDFDLVYYDGATRAAEGPSTNCWKYVELESDKIMHPGRLYMIYFAGSPTTVRFTKVNMAGNPILNTSLNVSPYASSTGDDADANWNGIANPSVYYAYLNAGVTEGQIYNAAARSYNAYTLNNHKLIVGQPVFVQVTNAKTVVANQTAFGALSAPRRTLAQNASARFEVELSANGIMQDRLIVVADEEKTENKYVIGEDLSKAGISDLVAQMWIDRYNVRLCKNTIAPINESADYPLVVRTQRAGEHTIYIASQENDNVALYLTRNGEAIANLTDGGAFSLYLERGTTYEYGLRVSARAPQVTTGVDEAIVEAQGETAMKVLINNQVFIIRGNRVYSVDGQLVK